MWKLIIILYFRSLNAHLADVLADPTLLESDVLCLQETWCRRSDAIPVIPGYTCYLAGEGKGKGVATFVKSHLVERKKLLRVEKIGNEEFIHGLKLYFLDMHIINVYQPPNPSSQGHLNESVQILRRSIDPHQQTMICGDFNFNHLKEPGHKIGAALKSLGFRQIVMQPTTIYGSCLDHVYLRSNFLHKYKLYYPYYSDHECVCVMLKKPIQK